jgi:ubiquinone/menaquinone biosynthesis C-methylase UbiE
MRSTEFAYKIPEKMYRKLPEQRIQLLNNIVRFIEPKSGEIIVDVGTGAGFLAIELAGRVGKSGKVVGLDVSRSAVQQARWRVAGKNQYQVIEFSIGDVYSLPFEDDFADVVCCKSLIASLDYHQKAIREMARVAKHGGRVIVVEPGELVGLPIPIKRAYYEAIHRNPLNEHYVKDLFQRTGLRSMEVVVSEPPLITDASTFEWTTRNLFGERSFWEFAVEGGAKEEEVRLVHEEMVRQIKANGLEFGTQAILCKGTKPR